MKKIAMIAGVTLLTSGCATQTYLLTDGKVSAEPSKTENQTFFVSGLGQEQKIDAEQVCGGAQNVGKIQTTLSPLNAILGGLTQGIYTPRQISVYCKYK